MKFFGSTCREFGDARNFSVDFAATQANLNESSLGPEESDAKFQKVAKVNAYNCSVRELNVKRKN